MKRARVLVVDDSAFARMVIARLLTASSEIEVIGTAHDGREALEQIAARNPDIVTLDITMPELDGLGVLRALGGRPRPRVIVVSASSIETELGAEALALGAIALVAKPTALASERLAGIRDELLACVLAATQPIPAIPASALARTRTSPVRLIAVGTSTGGPQALTHLLGALPANLAAPVVIALHIPAGYTEALAARLDKLSALHVVEAHDGLELRPGLAVIAPGGLNLRVEASAGVLRCRLSGLPITPFRPSVDELFTSAAGAVGNALLGVVLTGMGDDGLVGARLIASKGGSLLTEAAGSCVVYGMPRSVFEADLGARAIPLHGMAEEIAAHV
jgi:two-component system, chemotaxis family, protein-glutamate methylesterase/glutaminase